MFTQIRCTQLAKKHSSRHICAPHTFTYTCTRITYLMYMVCTYVNTNSLHTACKKACTCICLTRVFFCKLCATDLYGHMCTPYYIKCMMRVHMYVHVWGMHMYMPKSFFCRLWVTDLCTYVHTLYIKWTMRAHVYAYFFFLFFLKHM